MKNSTGHCGDGIFCQRTRRLFSITVFCLWLPMAFVCPSQELNDHSLLVLLCVFNFSTPKCSKTLKLNFESSKGVKVLISEIRKLNYLVKLDSNRKLFRMTVFSTNFVCQLCRGFPQGVIVWVRQQNESTPPLEGWVWCKLRLSGESLR